MEGFPQPIKKGRIVLYDQAEVLEWLGKSSEDDTETLDPEGYLSCRSCGDENYEYLEEGLCFDCFREKP